MLACAPHEPMLVILYMLCSSTPRSRKSQAAQCPQKENEATVKMKRGQTSGDGEVIYGPFDRGLLCQMIPKVVTFMDHFFKHLTEETSVKWSKKW